MLTKTLPKDSFAAAIMFDSAFQFVFLKCSSNYFYLKYIKSMFFKVFFYFFNVIMLEMKNKIYKNIIFIYF